MHECRLFLFYFPSFGHGLTDLVRPVPHGQATETHGCCSHSNHARDQCPVVDVLREHDLGFHHMEKLIVISVVMTEYNKTSSNN